MQILDGSPSSIRKAAFLLSEGEVVAIPTETVYGLATDATNEQAVTKIFEVKNRPTHNPLILHFGDLDLVKEHVWANDALNQLAEAFWPGPLTLILPKKDSIPDICSGGLRTVGVRIPSHPTLLAILDEFKKPISAPSANPSNYISPTRIEHVESQLGSKIKWGVDGGPCKSGIESTILDISDPGKPKILRPGPISKEKIEEVLKRQLLSVDRSADIDEEVSSPGQFKKHYSPKTPLLQEPSSETKKRAFITIAGGDIPSTDHFPLTTGGNPKEAEKNLYKLLHQIDQAGYDEIVIAELPADPDWTAVRDRIERAIHRSD